MADFVSSDAGEQRRGQFSGAALGPGGPGHEQARPARNGVIARCQGATDVVDAVTLGRNNGVAISVHGGP